MPGYDAVAVPSYRRPETCCRDTLSALLAGGVPAERVHVFIGGGEAGAYRALLPDKRITLHAAPVGVANAHNAILDTFPAGTRVVCMDDDVRGIQRLTPDGKLAPAENLHGLFTAAFAYCAEQRVTLWGLAPARNPMFMRRRWRTGLAFAIGQCFGQAVTDPPLRLHAPAKEDYERTLLHYQLDGAVARLDDHVAHTRPMRGHPGGMQTEGNRRANEQQAARYLAQRWPGLVHPKPDRDGYPEIALRLPRAA